MMDCALRVTNHGIASEELTLTRECFGMVFGPPTASGLEGFVSTGRRGEAGTFRESVIIKRIERSDIQMIRHYLPAIRNDGLAICDYTLKRCDYLPTRGRDIRAICG